MKHNGLTSGAYLEPYQTSKMEIFAKIANAWKPLIIFAKCSILDVWEGSEYASALFKVPNQVVFPKIATI